MNLNEFTSSIHNSINNADVVYFTHSLSKFTDSDFIFSLVTETVTINLSLSNKIQDYYNTSENERKIYVLFCCLFQTGKKIICWNVKEFFTWMNVNVPEIHNIEITSEVIDLKPLEHYLGLNTEPPETFESAKGRLAHIQAQSIYKLNNRVFSPLALRTLPKIESRGLIDITGDRNYFSYTIEGQVNGRLNCNSYGMFNPHTLGDKEKQNIICPHNKFFVMYDYKHMELSVLAWACEDKKLLQIIDSERDLYCEIYKLLSNSKNCSDSNRDLIKKLFLPVVYGIQIDSLCKNLNVSKNGAKYLIDLCRSNFSRIFEYAESISDKAKKDGVVVSPFGRVGFYNQESNRKPYTAINGVIQSAGGLICQSKLIDLCDSSVDVCAFVHDAYLTYCDKDSLEDSVKMNSELLKSSFDLFNCRLNLSVKYGKKLNDMKILELKGKNEQVYSDE